MRTPFLFSLALLISPSAIALETMREAVERTEASFPSVSCTYVAVSDLRIENESVHRKETAEWNLDSDGTGKFHSDGDVTLLENGEVLSSRTEQVKGTVEDQVRTYDVIKDGVLTTSRTAPSPNFYICVSPHDMVLLYRRKRHSQFLKPECVVLKEEKWEGRNVQVVDISPAIPLSDYKRMLWIDVERGCVVRAIESVTSP